MRVNSIAEQLIFATLRIETCAANGDTDVGTGFLYSVDVGSEQSALFLVTNRYFVQNARTGILALTLSDSSGGPNLGQTFNIKLENFANSFVPHENPEHDVALMPFFPVLQMVNERGAQVFFKPVADELIPTPEQISDLGVIEDVIFVGYPNGIGDPENNLPIVRRGITATPVGVDFHKEPKFLIDASVSGSLGCPSVVTSKPANGGQSKPANGLSPRPCSFISLPPDPASPFWFSNCAVRI